MLRRFVAGVVRLVHAVIWGGGRPPEDIAPLDFADLNWDEDHRRASIMQLYDSTVGEARKAIDWYGQKKPFKKHMAQGLRLIAILATIIAGIIPIIAPTDVLGVTIRPAWASVVVALGVGAIGLDRFFGFSSGWMRFLLARQRLENRLLTFQYEWETDEVTWQQTALSVEKTQDLIRRCAAFATEIRDLVTEETKLWVQEFQSTLEGLEESLRAEAEVKRTGAINITIEDHASLDDGWALHLNGRHVEDFSGATGTAKDLKPGQYTVRVTATRSGAAVEAVRTEDVTGGAVTDVSVSLA